jgi:serine protease AprX
VPTRRQGSDPVDRDRIEELFYGRPDQQRRFTQDFPILPDVWIAYGRSPADRLELLLSPHNESNAATAASQLRQRLERDRSAAGGRWQAAHPKLPPPRVLFNESVVLAALSFWELLRDALPLTDWWKRAIAPLGIEWTRASLGALASRLNSNPAGASALTTGADPRLLVKLIRIAAVIEGERRGRPVPEVPVEQPTLTQPEIDGFADLFDGLEPPEPAASGVVWSASLNRPASTGVWRSRLTVKADAAARLFDMKTAGIRWALLDTGVDARHPAFKRRDASGAVRAPDPTAGADDALNSRVVRTYDFLRIKELLDPDAPMPTGGDPVEASRLQPVREELARSLKMGRAIDWTLLEPLLRVPHTAGGYKPPQFDSHGTHVAGILAANWPEAATETPIQEPLYGVCPDLEIYDLRVLPDNPKDTADEFTIIAALQFVRHLNAHKDLMVIHGVNLSLSVPHDVANYACGRTPVCEECERVVAGGVVVVTAAGNRGFDKRERDPAAYGDYRYISITDPGNADGVITVGSTHRMLPHNYGVSYFSSRGPTGDGRRKPDLVAPGERIDSCALNDYYGTMDGTSMAAPHVSGAAALLLARHRELIGDPRRVKDILARTATDLGREARFQGAGMVDVLRAIQSI